MSGESELLRQQLEEVRAPTESVRLETDAKLESERAARKAAEAVVLRIPLVDMRAEIESLTAARSGRRNGAPASVGPHVA